MSDQKISTIEEARDFFANSENEGKHCVFVMPDQTEASLVSLENAETFFATLEESNVSTEEGVKAGSGETTQTEEAQAETTEEAANAENGEAVQAEEAAPATTEEA